MKLPYTEFDLSGLASYPLASRASKVRVEAFARVLSEAPAGEGSAPGSRRCPTCSARRISRRWWRRCARARSAGRPILWGLGAHVIKTGLAPVLIDLMERGFVSAMALNGAGIIHDFEIALSGATSEDVDAALGPGRFGMAEETGTVLNRVINAGRGPGPGPWPGRGDATWPRAIRPTPRSACWRRPRASGVPVTVHVAIGTDIIHMHPSASGAAIGEGSLRDFRYFVSNVAALAGGVYLNCGSAVILPEVFLKAVALVRNRGLSLDGLTTVNLDFMRMYRPQTNVVTRPTAGVGRGYALVGPHENADSAARGGARDALTPPGPPPGLCLARLRRPSGARPRAGSLDACYTLGVRTAT